MEDRLEEGQSDRAQTYGRGQNGDVHIRWSDETGRDVVRSERSRSGAGQPRRTGVRLGDITPICS